MNTKQQLYNACLQFVEDRFKTIQNTIYGIQESLTSETKSSAGDKHETGRAMLQLEREKAGNQLAEIQKVKTQLSKIDIQKASEVIGLGSLVYTNQYNYFIAISAGQLTAESESFYAISADTPIGKLLMGNSAGDKIEFRQQIFVIKNVL